MTEAVYPIIGKQAELPFYLTGVGVSDPEIHVVRHTGLSSHQFLFTSSGTGVLYVDGAEYRQEKGSVFYLAPGKPHEYHPIDGDWVTSWLVFRGEHAHELMRNLGFDGFAHADNCNTARCEALFRKIQAAANDPINGGESASILVYEYILAVRETMLLKSRYGAGKSNITTDALIYIDKNYMQDIAIDTLAGLAGVSVQHFCRVFKADTLMRPLEYLARRRVSEAKALLSNTALEICEVGRRVGYPDRNYFSIVFRRLEGVSPREYRRNKGSAIIM